jgi:hypothetical protein
MRLAKILLVVLSAWVAACDPPPATPSARAPSAPAPAASSGSRMPVFVDRKKQTPFERGRARLLTIRDALLSPSLSEAKTTELGFECASLGAERLALAAETDPLVDRFRADAQRTCGLDVPLATAYVELHAIELKRLSNGGVKTECFGLKVALRDFAAEYVDNPTVTEIKGKYDAWCRTTE